MLSDDCYAVIMAGGSGTRLWPLSRRAQPKHFLKLFGGRSLVELTVDRLRGHVPEERILLMTSAENEEVAQQTLPQIPPENVICEPCVRDTASAIGLAATVLKARWPAATMIVLTADQLIEPAGGFGRALFHAVSYLDSYPDQLVAFGVEAVAPSTLVGWQKLGETVDFPGCEVKRIAAFREKPELETAQRFMAEGGYRWNSGQFAWKAETILREIDAHLPEASSWLAKIGQAWNTAERDGILADAYPRMPKISIDYGVMQRTGNACSILLPCRWEDLGTHAALAGRIGEKRDTNLVMGRAFVPGADNVVLSDTSQCVVVASDNLTVVVTESAVFVGDRSTDMKALLGEVAQQAPELL